MNLLEAVSQGAAASISVISHCMVNLIALLVSLHLKIEQVILSVIYDALLSIVTNG